MKKIVFISLLIVSFGCFGQNDTSLDSLKMYESDPIPIYSKDYMRKYNHYKRLILKVYPYALYASDVLYQLEATAEGIAKDRKKKKFYKTAYKDLKEDFKYVFLGMYTSEGRMLMKLVHRETGMTVHEIATLYKGKTSATIFDIMGKMWNQDVHIKWEATGEDKIGEHVIQDIESGIIEFDSKVVRVEKEQYKENKREHRKRLRENKKRRRKNKRSCDKKEQ
ncbi:MAG: DUF4294 domain-containing protein [Crocinitomicaceae bacterium]|nr:DUF4294 domain-containing protein [Crocinitomicaceae bacterium]